jgi:hypothetical protein
MVTNERIEAEVAAEVKRISAWNENVDQTIPSRHFLCPDMCAGYGLKEEDGPLCPHQVYSLANHLVRNRLTVEMLDSGLLAALKAAITCRDGMLYHQLPISVQKQVNAAILAEEARRG